ncbi:MAG: hypothetical protein AAF318_16400 [Pseudomonadota bacterium]
MVRNLLIAAFLVLVIVVAVAFELPVFALVAGLMAAFGRGG